MPVDVLSTRCYCNIQAMQKGLHPLGHAGYFTDAVIVEMPLPWKVNAAEMALPAPVKALLDEWLEAYYQTGSYDHRPLFIAPDPAYSESGMRRVIFFTRPQGAFSRFDKTEYLIPENALGDLVWAWYKAPDGLAQYEAYRQPAQDMVRDILVCTHGNVDVACAKFGYPLYKHLRDIYACEEVRVWRVSHFGGHVFAPTMMDMPFGHYWAYVGEEQAAQILKHEGQISDLDGFYRGWAGLEGGFLQAAEGHLWQQHGWEWLNYPKTAELIAQDDHEEPQWADVRVRFRSPHDGDKTAVTVRIHVERRVETPSTSDQKYTYVYAQYRVTHA